MSPFGSACWYEQLRPSTGLTRSAPLTLQKMSSLKICQEPRSASHILSQLPCIAILVAYKRFLRPFEQNAETGH